MQYEFEALVLSAVSIIFVFIGGCFALWQWNKNLVYKRTEIVRELIESIRKDKTVSAIMDVVDWNEDFLYDGKFVVNENTTRTALKGLSSDDLFKMIDHTLSLFSYVCYLKKMRTISSSDMRFFEYEIRRLADNPHIGNYLYSLHHWSKKLGVKMSFSYFVDYCIKKKYIDKSFRNLDSHSLEYTCFLAI